MPANRLKWLVAFLLLIGWRGASAETIVYVDLEPNIVLLSNGSGLTNTVLDIDGDASYDLTLAHVYNVSTNRFAARGQRAFGGGAAYMRSGGGVMRRLSAGDVIGPDGTFQDTQGDVSLAEDFSSAPAEFEHPDTAQAGFIGFRLLSGSYGWIEVEVAPQNAGLQRYQLTIKGYAYDADGDPIVAGEIPDADGDGILDAYDTCPNSPNVWNVTQNTYHPTIQAGLDAA
ncbi:MAG: thrombospondin type 3 repeat-containing protein, partial [Phycisphaerales bacterium]|nr:thrombospondin type 3 repeat-containing protein [Phycisphaerales bacterium]